MCFQTAFAHKTPAGARWLFLFQNIAAHGGVVFVEGVAERAFAAAVHLRDEVEVLFGRGVGGGFEGGFAGQGDGGGGEAGAGVGVVGRVALQVGFAASCRC